MRYLLFLAFFINVLLSSSLDFTKEELEFIQKQEPIKVGSMNNYTPFSYLKDKQMMGFTHDLLDVISKKSGLKFEKINGNWSQIYKKFENEEIDLITELSYTEKRAEFIDFTPSYYELPIGVFTKKDFGEYIGLKSLEGKRVAILKGSYLTKKLKRIPNVKIVEVSSSLEKILALENNYADALLSNELSLFRTESLLLKKIELKGYFGFDSIIKEDLRFGVLKKNKLLSSIINKTVHEIPFSQISLLKEKWVFSKFEDEETFKKYNLDFLSQEEKEYLKNNPILKVQGILGFAPFNFYKDGKAVGFTIDYFNLLGKYLNVEFEFITGKKFPETIKMFKEGQIDILPSIVRNKQREEFIEYTDFNHLDYLLGVALKKELKANSFESLKNRTIAVIDKTFIHSFIKTNFPKQKLYFVKNTDEGVQAVSSNKADAFIGSIPTMDFFIKKHWLNNLYITQIEDIKLPKTIFLPMGVQKGNKTLKSILKKVDAEIDFSEIARLQEKWFYKRNISSMSLNLSQKEQEYLAKKGEIKVCAAPDWMPFEEIDSNGLHKGIGKDTIEIIAKKLDKEFTFVKTKEWSDSLQYIRDKKCDILPLAMNLASRKDSMYFTKPYIIEPFVIATKSNEFFIKDEKSLSGKRIGIVKDYAFVEVLREKNPLIEIVEVKNTKEGLEKVQSGELFGYVDAMPSIGYYIQKYGYLDLKIAGKLPFDITLSIASRNDEPLLNSIMQKSLNTISEDEIRKIVGRWIEIKVQEQFDYKTLFTVTVVFLVIVSLLVYRGRKLDEQKNEFKSLIESSSDGVFIMSLKGDLLECSNKACEMLGYTKDEMLELNLVDWQHLYTKEDIEKILSSLTKETKIIHTKHRRKDKSFYDAEIYVNRIVLSNKELIYSSVRDITKEKELQKKILEQKKELESIFNYSKDGIALIDLETKFLKVNQAYIDLTGFSEAELLRKSCMELTASEDAHRMKEAFDTALEKGYFSNLEKTCIVNENKRVQVNTSISVLPDKKTFIVLTKDMTKIKNLESQSRLASMGQMVGNIAHQWRQPLSVMTTFASGLKLRIEMEDKVDNKTINECMDVVVEQCNYLSNTIESFRDFIKDDKQFKTLSLKTILENTLSLTKASLDNNYITLEKDLSFDLKIYGNSNELVEAFLNVINNAKDVLKENIKNEDDRFVFISINKCKDENFAEVLIKDTGGGIKEDIIEKIFDPYFTTKHQTQGTGLGLSIVDKIIRQRHNGSITAYNDLFKHKNKEYKGACFSIKFEINEEFNI